MSQLNEAALDVAAIVCFRALPMVAAALLMIRGRMLAKALLILVFAGFVYALRVWTVIDFAGVAAGYAYLVIACCGLPFAASFLRQHRVMPALLFTTCLVVFLLMPAMAWPLRIKIAALMLCWDLVLSSYSYCVEVAKAPRNPSWSESLFFLLVNPTVVYTQRGTRIGPPKLALAGLGRSVLGAASIFAVFVFVNPVYHVLGAEAVAGGDTWTAVTRAVLRFFREYGLQSGVASLQIGFLLQVGHVVPERFAWPIFATSVPDFWRRWNIYMGQWLLRYVFWPVTLSLGRLAKGRARSALVSAAGVLFTFLFIGALHDLYIYCASGPLEPLMTQLFVLNGVLVVLSLAVAKVWSAASGPRWVEGFRQTIAFTGAKASFWCAAILCLQILL